MSQKYIDLIKKHSSCNDAKLDKICNLVPLILEKMIAYPQSLRSDLINLFIPLVTKDIAPIIVDYYINYDIFERIFKEFDERPLNFVGFLFPYIYRPLDNIDNLIEDIFIETSYNISQTTEKI